MSSHKHSFQCFNAIDGKGSHNPSPPFKQHTPYLPRIPQHGSMVHPDNADECCPCSEYRQARALEAEETQLSDFHQTHPLYHKYHPHQYVVRAPGRPEEGQECPIHHHRHNKRVVLVKSSDPSVKKTIILHRRSLRSISLFLEEISELMHFNIRKLYTPDGQKIDSIQSLLQCPGVLVCVGREPLPPSAKDHFSADKLLKLGGKSCFTDTTDGHKRLGPEKSVIPPKTESEIKGKKRSHERSVPDNADSPDLIGSLPPTDNNIKDDDIKKRVHINKDGSLSMEMKVRFRLHNDETLHWSTKVRKSSGRASEFKQGHSNAYFAQVSDRSFSESETFSAEEVCVTRPYPRYAEEPHCPLCSSHFQDYDMWENVPDTHGARRCVHSSSSSASSHTVVSRKTIVETQSVSRSSEDLSEQVIEKETCIKKIIQAAETVEYCTVCDEGKGASQRASRASNKSNLDVGKKASSPSAGSDKPNYSKPYQICQCGTSPGRVNERIEHMINQDEDKEEESAILSSAMSVKSNASNTSENTENTTCRYSQGRRSKRAMSSYSDGSTRSTCSVLEDAVRGQQAAKVKVTQERTPSCQSVKSIKGEGSVKLETSQEYLKPEEDGKEERASSSVSSKVSTRSKGSRISSVLSEKPPYEDLELRTPSTMSAISNVSAELKHIAYETSEEESGQSSAEEKESDQNAQSMISEKGDVSPKSETSEAAPTENTQDFQDAKKERERTQSVESVESVGSNSSTPVQESKGFEATNVRTTSAFSVQSNASTKSTEPKERHHSTQSLKSVVSNKSTKSERRETDEILNLKDDDTVDNGYVGEPKEETEVEKRPNSCEVRITSGMSSSKVKQVQQSDINEDNSEETICGGETKGSLSSNSTTLSRSNSSACGPTNENTEISLEENEVNTEDRGPSRVSVNSVQSHAERAPSTLSSKTAKSHTSVKSNKSNTKTLDDKTTEEETQERTQSVLSINSTESEADTKTGKHTPELKEQVERTPSNLSVRSEKSHTSVLSQKSKVSEATMGKEVRIVEGEDVNRPLSIHSVVSDVSIGSNKSNCPNSRESPDVENIKESTEERPSSTRSSRSKQSCVSKISEERPQSTLSAKSTKSFKSEFFIVDVDTKAGGQEDEDEIQKRGESVRSAKSEKSAKTHKSKDRDVKEEASDSDRERRSPSILSVKSAKSTMSKASTRSKKSNVSKSGLESDVDSLDEQNKGGSGSETIRSVSVQSVDSSVSGKSKTQKSPVDVPPDEESVISEQSSKEKSDKRPPSAMSAKSEESSLSEMSINSVETANSATSFKSARSRGSTKSVKSKASENCSGKPPEERGCEDLGETNGQDCSTAEEECDDNKPVSDLSGKSVTPKASIDVYMVCSEDVPNNTNDKVTEGGSKSRPLSAQSFDSNKSANKSNYTTDPPVSSDIIYCDDTSKQPEPESVASTGSTKSVQSNISDTSGSHGKKTSSALSAKSSKSSASDESVQSKDSDPQSARASEIDTEDQERTGSVSSVKSNHSEKSVQSERPERSDVDSTTDCEKLTNRGQSNLSFKPEKSAKSNTMMVSKRSKVSEKVENTDRDNTEQSEEKASSCTSLKSFQSHVSESSRKSCADGSHAEERAQSVLSVKSVKSTRSAKSNESKGMDDPSKGGIPDEKEKESRTLSSMSERSKSTESNVSAVSKKSEVSVSCEDATEKEQEKEDLENRSVMSDTSARSSRPKCGSHFPSKANSQPQSQSSSKSLRSNLSASSVHSTPGEKIDDEGQDSAKSASPEKSTTSKKSKVSASPAEGSASGSEDLEIPASTLSVNSAKSGIFSETKKSNVSDQQSGFASKATDADNEGRMSSLSTLTNRSNISARSKLSKGSDTVTSQNFESENNDDDEEKSFISIKSDQSCVSAKSEKNETTDEKEKTTERAPSTLSARSTKSEKSTKPRELIVSDTPADDCVSEKSVVSVHSHRSTEMDLHEESTSEEKTKGTPSCVLNGSEDSIVSGQSVISVTSNDSRKSPKNCEPSADSNEEQTVEEVGRSPRSMSESTDKSNTYVSSRNGTPHDGPLENFTNEGERSPSIVSTKSSTSVKSTQQSSTKFSRSKVSDSQHGETLDEQINRPLCKTSMKSAKSEQSVHDVDENKEEDACKRVISPISAKSNTTSTTAKSNTSRNTKTSRNLEGLEDENVEKTPSLLSVKSNSSSKTMQSNRSSTSNRKTIADKVDTDDIKDGVRSTKSAKSHQSEVPAVTVEESVDRSPTTMSLKSKTSGHSKRSKSSESQRSERKTKGSLSVHSHLSSNSKRSRVTDVSAATVTSSNPAKVVKITGKMSDGPLQPLKIKNNLIHQSESKESDLSQTLSSSDVLKETGEISAPLESKSLSKKDSSSRPKNKEGDESELVPSILPNTSPTEVVNEWLKTIPPDSDIYEMEDLSEKCEKCSQAAEGGKEAEENKKTDNSSTDSSKDINTGEAMNPELNDDGKTGTVTPNDNSCQHSPQTDDASKMLNSSVQVMRVLLNPKPDRCNSLPEISPVYGRKLSTSATGLLDCLVKLQLLDHNPKNANKPDKKYQDLMQILQSLWLCDPSQNDQTPTRNNNHFVEDEYNHTSSSGVDVNSGSTGSGKSSDGIKSSNSNHEDASQLHSIPVLKDPNEDAVWQSEREEQKLEGDHLETNDGIRYNYSPRETPETQTSTNESPGTSSTTSQKLLQEAEPKAEEDYDAESPVLSRGANLTKNMSHNPDPVWVLNLLTKIEKQFMVHYVHAMKEFKGRWNLADNDQLDEIINELKVEIERRIQKSINREVRKIQDSVGLPRPPNDTGSHDSTGQAKGRKQKLKKSLQHSAGSHEEKSDHSTTGTSYSDQRSENIDESCLCETCIKTSINSEASLTAEVTNMTHSENSGSGDEAKLAVALVENIVVAAMKEMEGEKVDRCSENTTPYEEDEKEDDSKSMKFLTKHEINKSPLLTEEDSTDNEISREEAKTAEETTLEGETRDSDEDEASGDEDAVMEPGVETAADQESATDGSQEEELAENEAHVKNERKLLKEASIATTAAEEKESEASTAASSEHESERDEVVEDLDELNRETAVEARRVDDKEEDGGIEDLAGDSNSTTNDDDTTEDGTSHRHSSEAAEDATEDEVAAENESEVMRDDEVCNIQTKDSASEDEIVEETNMLAESEHGSVIEKQSNESLQSDQEVTSEDDSPHENQDSATANDLNKEEDDIERTKGDALKHKHSTGEDDEEEEVRASSDHGSESEEPVEIEKVHEEEESSAASESHSVEDLATTSDAISGEDEEETAGSVSKHDTDTDEEESSVIKQDKPYEISADEDKNTSTAAESSLKEEDANMTDDNSAADIDDAATSRSESKDATDEDETDKDEETELHTQVMVEDTADDGNDTGVVSEDHFTEDESDATCCEFSNKQPEKSLEKTKEKPSTPETNSGAENDSDEDEPDLANNKAATDEESKVINKEYDQGEDFVNKESEGEEEHGETPMVDQVDITSEDVEEDTTSSQDDSGENEDASTKEETSTTEKETSCEEEINKVNSKSTEASNDEVLDECDVKDAEESCSEDESKEQSSNSETDDSRPGSSATGTNDTTGQDETKVTESQDESEVEPKNLVLDEILEEASDENETSRKSEEQEETESSDKPVDSSANELLTEDKSEDDKSHSEEVTEREHETLVEETEVQTFITNDTAVGQKINEEVRNHEGKDCISCNKEKKMDDALDKEDETETGNDDWSGDEGNCADEEDEAEEDEPEERNQVELKPLAVSKATNQVQADRRGKETLLTPLDTLKKEKEESEDGAYADVEDSEAEING